MTLLDLKPRPLALAAALALGGIAMTGCTTTTPRNNNAQSPNHTSREAAIDANVQSTLLRLYDNAPGSNELVQKAAGVLVFPAVIGGGFVVGAEYGRGALLAGGRTAGYFSTTAGSIGFQAGGQSKAVIYVFNTREALDKFLNSNGWTVGVDANVTIATVGANASVNNHTIQQPVVGYVLTNVGLEAGASVLGAKISRIKP
ncbi:MAG: YSC84-related protein [Desulfovibrionaceae bacterium]|jgi:lipid-binding SYLF domain-containing protein|nr:YSC84-related protein [Desulfovibrionaceae bacterium]